jgi:hypothetical protein
MGYFLPVVIFVGTIGLAIGNYLSRKPPRDGLAQWLCAGGIFLAVLVVIQFFVGQAMMNAALSNMRGIMFGLAGGGSL